ncbi:McrC family protein [Bacillus cereus]|uniref:McrC family protein n=1 Tax=Bacillus cereus TaxID=1396 RepID=UPI002AC185AC|nr:hypothetical protein [Bacillus cereus]MCU5529346.1 McrC family protein [Bacillus cereus]MDZ4481604.1 hypothetical protein [Bacillus cereus]
MKISVLEHEKIYFAAKTDITNKRISEKYKQLLFQIEEKQQNKLFKWGRNFVTPQQWVGIIHFSDLTIEILPKIADEIPLEETRGILINMLKVVHDIPVRDKIKSEFAFSKNGLLDILVAFFIKELEMQLRKGIFKTYCKTKKRLNKIKGSLDISAQINNIFMVDKFSCKYSYYTVDNLLNQIIKYTLTLIATLDISSANKTAVKRLLVLFEEVSYKNIQSIDIENFKLDRLNQRYDAILKMCKMFIRSYSFEIKCGENILDFMLFDMNKLFEKFIYKTLQKIYGSRVQAQVTKNYLLKSLESGKQKIMMKPDIVLYNEDSAIILDTKWKVIRSFVSEADVYQMNAYSHSFHNIESSILLYPKSPSNDRVVGSYEIQSNIGKKILLIKTIDLGQAARMSVFRKELIKLLEGRENSAYSR